ncbi:MAG: hypothetical protein HUU43_17220 [Ignavibacteriaceae bacterium]|nr:hypothetical protein [Ignavibacteriaceae bacterium]
MKKCFFILPAMISLLLLQGCGSIIPVTSLRIADKITIDGKYEEWGDALNFPGDENIGIAFSNSEDNLCLCLITQDREKIRKILTAGMTITFEPADKKNKIAIGFPVRKDFTGPQVFGKDKNGIPDEEKLFSDLISEYRELHVFDAEGDLINVHQFPGNADYSFALASENGVLIYELRLPLGFSYQRATGLRAKAGEDIKVTIESGSFNKKESPQGKGMPGGGGGHQGGGMRGRAGGGGMPHGGEGRPDAPDFKPIKIELLLKIG